MEVISEKRELETVLENAHPSALLRAVLAAGQQVGNGAVALRVPNLGVALVLAFHKSRVVGLIELTFHI